MPVSRLTLHEISYDKYYAIALSHFRSFPDATLNTVARLKDGNVELYIRQIDNLAYLVLTSYKRGGPVLRVIFEMRCGQLTKKRLAEAWQRRSHGLSYLKDLYRQLST